jgi:hypothetical protein
MYTSDLDLVFVQKRLAEAFNLEELKMLCLMLGVNYENIAGDTLNGKTRELVIFCYKYGRLKDLLEQSKDLNPSIDWSPAYRSVHRQTELPEEWAEPLQQLYYLTKDFNRNRALPFSEARTRDGDEIAFRMREAAPFVYAQFDERAWLRSGNTGKRLAAVKYLDWAQNVELFARLLSMLFLERPFMQFHVLLALDSMIDQLDPRQRWILKNLLTLYRGGQRDSNREFWRQRMLKRLHV